MRIGYVNGLPGFSASTQEKILIEAGVPEKRIYIEGRDAETLAAALRAMRTDIDLECAGGLRALGNGRKEIVAAVEIIHAKGKVVLDPVTGERSGPGAGARMLDRALARIAGEKTGIITRARELGRLGGKARAAAHEGYKRNTADRKAWRSKDFLTDSEAASHIGYSPNHLRRHYGSSGRKRGQKPKS